MVFADIRTVHQNVVSICKVDKNITDINLHNKHTESLQAMVANSADESSTRTQLAKLFFFTKASTNGWHDTPHSLIAKSHFSTSSSHKKYEKKNSRSVTVLPARP